LKFYLSDEARRAKSEKNPKFESSRRSYAAMAEKLTKYSKYCPSWLICFGFMILVDIYF